MLNLTQSIFKLAPPGGVFDDTVIGNLFPDLGVGARRALVHRAVKKGEVLRLKPGLFCLTADFTKSSLHVFAVAQLLHYGSHISVESALAHHGLIPEAVFQVASVTPKRSRAYRTHLGTFTYHRVPTNYSRAGVAVTKLGEGSWAFVAGPLRAIADLVYLRREISWKVDGVGFLIDSMRIELDDLRELPLSDFEKVASAIRNRRTRAYLEGLMKELT